MNKTIKVKTGIPPIEHKSFFSATNFPKKISEYDLREKVNGATVLEYQYDGQNILFQLSNNQCVCVFVSNNKIECSIENKFINLDRQFPYDSLTFEFSTEEVYIWKWEEVLKYFVGRKIAFSEGEQFLFLYTDDDKEYMFDTVLYNSENILYLSEV